MIVKINRKSIKKNPRAGSSSFLINGPREISFVIEGELPAILKDGENVYLTRETKGVKHEGSLRDFGLLDYLLTLKNCVVTVDNNVQVVNHAPEGKWLYKYENPILKCKSCKKNVVLDSIKEDYFDDVGMMTICPKCGGYDTFTTILYEKINDVLKELKKAP